MKASLNFSQNRLSYPAFGAIYPDRCAKNIAQYEKYYQDSADFDFYKLTFNTTNLFREVESQLELMDLLDPNKKTAVKVLGCSDGSEVYSYAIALAQKFGDKARKNFKVLGVDYDSAMIALARTKSLVLSEKESNTQDVDLNKITDCWINLAKCSYLEKAKKPLEFDELKEMYPELRYVEYDPVSKSKIGNELNWYSAKSNILPEIEFKFDDMMNCLDSTESTEAEVYVVANSSGYFIQENNGIQKYLDIFREIKSQNESKNKDVFVVIGDLELRALRNKFMDRYVDCELKRLGFQKSSTQNNSKIYKLSYL